MEPGTSGTKMSKGEKCRTCGGKLAPEAREKNRWYPFCCRRCRLIDLGQWFDEGYSLGEENPLPESPLPGESGGK